MKPKQPAVQFGDPTMTYLEDLLETGLYGEDLDQVAETLVLAGVRQAVEAGFIKLRDFPDVKIEEEV
jgi:hypothetical protein